MLQTDGTASCRNDAFVQKESKMASRFECEPIKFLSTGDQIFRNDALISFNGRTYAIWISNHIDKLQYINQGYVDKPTIVNQRRRGAYIAAVGKPDLPVGSAVVFHVLEPDESFAKGLNNFISQAKASFDFRLKFVSVE